MGLSTRLLVVGLAVSFTLASMPFPVVGQERKEPPPTDKDFQEQTKRIELKNSRRERLEAVQWLHRHVAANNAHLAIPALERCIREDPEADVRDAAVLSLARIAQKRRAPCPLVIVEAMLDKDEVVSQTAGALADQFQSFAPGSVDVLLRCAKSERADLRCTCLGPLAHAGVKDKKVLDVIQKAKQDKSFLVRHNAHVAIFEATDNLPEFLAYLIRLQEDPDGVLGKVDANSETGKREQVSRNLASLGAATLIVKWSDQRPDDLAPALLKLLAAPSPELRRGAARLIGACAIKVDLPDYSGKKSAPEPPKAPERQQRSKAGVRFEKLKAEDRLRELRDDDPDPTVRAAARLALERLATLREKGTPSKRQ